MAVASNTPDAEAIRDGRQIFQNSAWGAMVSASRPAGSRSLDRNRRATSDSGTTEYDGLEQYELDRDLAKPTQRKRDIPASSARGPGPMKTPRKQRYHIVHDREGRILALAPAGAVETRNGVHVGWRPVAGLHQFVAEIDLTPELVRGAPHDLLKKFQVQSTPKRQSSTAPQGRSLTILSPLAPTASVL